MCGHFSVTEVGVEEYFGFCVDGNHRFLLSDFVVTHNSQMLRAISKVSPRGVYISGGITSKTGLTVTMVRDGKDGDFALEAGALVLADQGCCCIDGTKRAREKSMRTLLFAFCIYSHVAFSSFMLQSSTR